MTNMVMVRIKRMGKQWAACGVPVYPPAHLIGKASAKRLCPKLVPGQVIKVPSDHNLLNQDCVEVVRRVEKDEFIRPWSFKSAEDALMANPSKSRLGADAIANGLNLAEGARDKGKRALAEREEAREEAERLEREERMTGTGKRRPADEDDGFYDKDETYEANDARYDEDEAEQDAYEPRRDNKLTQAEAEELRGKRDEEDDDPAPRGPGRSKPSTAATGQRGRAPRKPRG